MAILNNSPKIYLITVLLLAGTPFIMSSPCALAHTNVTAEQARELIDSTSNLIIVDVREPSEYCDDRHIPGSLNYPWNSGVLRARYEELSPNYPILVVCRSGGRSNSAANFLDSKGFPMVYDMLRGMSAWIWETTACKYDGGSGTAVDPYQIATAEDLMELGDNPDDYDKYFILTADIDLDPNLPSRKVFDKAVIAPDTEDTEWRFEGIPFTGVFDGNGHTISHLTISGNSYLGLFGQSDSEAEISNLGLEAVDINGNGENIGGLVGSNGGNITMCYSTGAVKGDWLVGGLVGFNWHNNITESITASYSTVMVRGDIFVGGFVGGNGGNLGGSITTCYSTGAVSGDRFVGGLVGINSAGGDGGVITNCYSTGSVTGNEDVGGFVGRNSGLGIINSCLWDVESSGQTTSNGGVGKTTAEMQDPNTFIDTGWDFISRPDGPHDIWIEPEVGGYPMLWWQSPPGFELPVFTGGNGEPNDPYLISTAEQLNLIGHNPKLMECHFKLTDDLDVTDLHFYPIGSPDYLYRGVFNGNGHTVSHLMIEGTSYLGMFGVIADGAEVKDLGVININVTGSDGNVGGLVGWNWGGTVINCYSTGTVSGGDWHVGGLVGENVNGTITGSHSNGSITGNNEVGGLVGENYGGSISKCYSSGTVTGGDWHVGGLVGSNSGIITTSYSACTVTGASYYVGGLVGINADRTSAIITNCYSTGMVTGKEDIGGLVGINTDRTSAIINNCYSTSSVRGNKDIGGFVGSNWRNNGITSSFWDVETSGLINMCGWGPPFCDDSFGKTTAEMQTAATFLEEGWDFLNETDNGTEDIWWIDEGNDYPHLWWE